MEVRLVNGLAGSGWMFNRMNDLFRESDSRTRQMVPSVDVIEDKGAYHFYFEMPGLKNESLDARVEGGRLIVSAERKWPEWSQDTRSTFLNAAMEPRRSFELPDDASHDEIAASYKDGVLEVTVEKKTESKSRRFLSTDRCASRRGVALRGSLDVYALIDNPRNRDEEAAAVHENQAIE